MKSFSIALVLWSGLVQAQSLVHVKNFNFTYLNPHGEGVATSFSRNNSAADESVNVSVDKVDSEFHIQVTGGEEHEFIFKDAPSFMSDADTINLSGFNLDFNDSLDLKLSTAHFHSQSDSLELNGLSLNCQKLGVEQNVLDKLISGCVQRMSFKSSKFSSQNADALISSSLNEALGSSFAGVGVNSVDFSTNNGRFDLSAEVKLQISGKVKSFGNISYDPESGKLTIKISEVKLGFLNITSKVFDELKKQENSKLTVREPYVYYLVK